MPDMTDGLALAGTIEVINRKCSTDYPVELHDPAVDATVRVRPRWAFGLVQEDLTGSRPAGASSLDRGARQARLGRMKSGAPAA